MLSSLFDVGVIELQGAEFTRGKLMKKCHVSILLLLVTCHSAFAIKITPFVDDDLFVERGKDIVIAECVSIPTNGQIFIAGRWFPKGELTKVEVDIIRMLKGDKQPGKTIIATIYPMDPGKKYFLYSMGGEVSEESGIPATDFLAVPELSVVEMPQNFDLKLLDGKELKEQVQRILSRSLFELNRELRPLLERKALLENAISNSEYEWHKSNGPVKIGRILEVSTTNQGSSVWLELEGKQLAWSASVPGKTGSLGFQKIDTSGTAYWEFSRCSAAKIEDLVDKPMKARFYGMYTPRYADFVRGELQYTHVSVGEVLLVRAAEAPRTIFVIQITGQDENRESMSARYAIIQSSGSQK